MIRIIRAYRPIDGEPLLPTVRTMVVNAAGSVARNTVSAATGNQLLAPGHVKVARKSKCLDGCPYFRQSDQRCAKCGCWTDYKLSLAAEKCPDNPPRWLPYLDIDKVITPAAK